MRVTVELAAAAAAVTSQLKNADTNEQMLYT